MILDDLKTEVEATVSVEASAAALIDGFAARLQTAVDNALAGGATADQLAGVQTQIDAMKAAREALATAVAANPA